MFAQVAKVQLSVSFPPLTVTGRVHSGVFGRWRVQIFTSSDDHVNIYHTPLQFRDFIPSQRHMVAETVVILIQ